MWILRQILLAIVYEVICERVCAAADDRCGRIGARLGIDWFGGGISCVLRLLMAPFHETRAAMAEVRTISRARLGKAAALVEEPVIYGNR